MITARYIYWEEDGGYIGYFVDFPDYLTQGDDLEDLKAHLLALYQDLTSGQIPGIRKSDELVVA